MQVSTPLGCLAGGSSCPAEEGVENITKAAEVKSFKASPEKPLSTTMPKAVIGSTLISVGEHFVSFIYLFKPLFGPIIAVAVGVIFKS
jgi:hypothetical protein